MYRHLSLCLLFGSLAPAMGFDPATQDDSAALARHFAERSDPVGPPIREGSFEPLAGETITLMGGADVFRMQEYGFFEAALQSAFPEKNLRVRNIGWPSDTVHRQQRPMYFYTETGDSREGSLPDQREKIEPGTFVMQFGRMESLDGIEALPEFEAAYQRLLDALKRHSRRLVLVEPLPFLEVGPAGSLAGERQEILDRYAAAIRRIAERNGATFVALDGLAASDFSESSGHPGDHGFRSLAKGLAAGLGFEASFDEAVVEAVRKKNHLWAQYYRPTNWAFLFGDRQWVPSSRDHRNTEHRWFVDEMERLPGMIEEADKRIWEAAK